MSAPPAVLVTGASTGIGEACVRRFDRRGWRVYAGVRTADDGERLRTQTSDRLRWLLLDVTRDDQIAAAADAIARDAKGAGLAGLVNNAGVAGGGPLEFVPLDVLRLQLDVNVVGLLAVTQAVLPLLREAKGRIVNVGSVSGLTVAPLAATYAASKHAVEALTDGLRLELRPAGIEVAVVEPGPVQTPIWRKTRAAMAPDRLAAGVTERYGGWLRVAERLLVHNEKTGMSPEVVVDAIEHALTARRPRTRYLLGRNARLRLLARRLLPDRWADALVHRVLARAERRLG